MQDALAKAGHADNCNGHIHDMSRGGICGFRKEWCDCYFSTLSDAVERGKKLLEQEAENERLRKALENHHKWHLEVGTMYVSDDGKDFTELDLTDAYSESSLCDETIAALGGPRPSTI